MVMYYGHSLGGMTIYVYLLIRIDRDLSDRSIVLCGCFILFERDYNWCMTITNDRVAFIMATRISIRAKHWLVVEDTFVDIIQFGYRRIYGLLLFINDVVFALKLSIFFY